MHQGFSGLCAGRFVGPDFIMRRITSTAAGTRCVPPSLRGTYANQKGRPSLDAKKIDKAHHRSITPPGFRASVRDAMAVSPRRIATNTRRPPINLYWIVPRGTV